MSFRWQCGLRVARRKPLRHPSLLISSFCECEYGMSNQNETAGNRRGKSEQPMPGEFPFDYSIGQRIDLFDLA